MKFKKMKELEQIYSELTEFPKQDLEADRIYTLM